MKGAPETLLSMCDPSSVPANYLEVLEEYTRQGYKVRYHEFAPTTP